MRIKWRHRIEYALLRALEALLGSLPPGAALRLGEAVAVVAGWVAGARLREAERRIRSLLGEDLAPGRVRGIARAAWRHLFLNLVELMRLERLDDAWIARFADVGPLGQVERDRAGAGLVIAVPHMGNWELAGLMGRRLGLPLFFMARRQANPLAEARLARLRARWGVLAIDRDRGGGLLRTVRLLRSGQVLAILPDVRARGSAVTVSFFGRDLPVKPGAAFFARKAGVPLVVAAVRREGRDRHVWETLPAIHPDPAADEQADLSRMMGEVFRAFEAWIRRHPEQYFWFNGRWLLPPAAPREADRAAPKT